MVPWRPRYILVYTLGCMRFPWQQWSAALKLISYMEITFASPPQKTKRKKLDVPGSQSTCHHVVFLHCVSPLCVSFVRSYLTGRDQIVPVREVEQRSVVWFNNQTTRGRAYTKVYQGQRLFNSILYRNVVSHSYFFLFYFCICFSCVFFCLFFCRSSSQ